MSINAMVVIKKEKPVPLQMIWMLFKLCKNCNCSTYSRRVTTRVIFNHATDAGLKILCNKSIIYLYLMNTHI